MLLTWIIVILVIVISTMVFIAIIILTTLHGVIVNFVVPMILMTFLQYSCNLHLLRLSFVCKLLWLLWSL